MRAIMLLIIGLNIMIAGTWAETEEHSVTLKWGESLGLYNYNITAMDFRPGTIQEHPEKCGNETNAYNRKIYGCDDWVLLRINKNGTHVADMALAEQNKTIAGIDFSNESTYNDSESSLRIIALDVVTGNTIPTPYAVLSITLNTSETAEFDIAGNLNINKIVPEEAHVSPCSPLIPITINISNIGTSDFSYISVVDSVGDGLVSEPRDLNWSISLEHGKTWQVEYKIKPLSPVAGAEYTLPPAILYIVRNNRIYDLPTKKISFILRSSDIILNKTANNVTADNVTVTINLSAKNNGSRAAWIDVKDFIPPDMELVSGDMNFTTVLQPGVFYNQTYILRLNNISGNISLPPANFSFDEYKTCQNTGVNKKTITGSGISNPVELTFVSPVSSPVQTTPPPAPSVETTSIEATPANNPGISGALWIHGFKLPYLYLAILTGVLVISVILFILKVWRLLGLFK